MTAMTASLSRSRLRARLVLAGLSACGLAALAWASFVQPLPRLIYNPSDSVPVGWYRVDPLHHRPGSQSRPLPPSLRVGSIVQTTLPPDAATLAAQRGYLPARVPLLKRVGAVAPQQVCVFDALVWIDGVPVAAVRPADRLGRPLPPSLHVGGIVLVPLPAEAAALAARRGYLPTRIPLLKRVGAVAPQEVCIAKGRVRIDGVPSAAVLPADRLGRPLPSWPQCRRLRPDELFLLSVTNPASFDSRYFGPVSASAVIGVARPIWLESRP